MSIMESEHFNKRNKKTTDRIPPLMARHVAVIGAGAAGLVAARELKREGHTVVVYEKADQVGGTWIYTSETESDLLGLDPKRITVHSSLYKSLRVNLPRELMGFRDYPFVPRSDPGSVDPRRYPGHQELLLYLQNFARHFGVSELVRLQTEVLLVRLAENNNKWKVKSRKKYEVAEEETFDAVVVCNGHYSHPRVAEVPGIDLWPGKQMHSHNYRIPTPFQNQVVILIGDNLSASDIKMELVGFAKEVHIASRAVADETHEKQLGYANMWLHSMVVRANEDGTVVFRNGRVVSADVIMHCTGYKYGFPFLETNGIVTVDDNRVGPLYKHVFPPVLAPGLSFVGIPQKVLPFLFFELQSKWVAGVLSSRIVLPSQEEMMEDVKAFYSKLEASGKPKRHTHYVFEALFKEVDWLAAQCSCQGFEEWRKKMTFAALKNHIARPRRYRDEWDDDHLVAESHKDFIRYASKL